MALTLTAFAGPYSTGDRFVTVKTVDFDSSYATGGEALARTDLGFASTADPEFEVRADPKAGFFFEYDYTNQKLLAYSVVRKFTATFDAASLAATTSRDDAITFTGVVSTDNVLAVIPPPAAAASVVVQNCRVTGTDTITARLTNSSAGAVDLASGTWTAYVVGANAEAKEVPNATDLSALTGVRVRAVGKYRL